jgi:hypothetical protein
MARQEFNASVLCPASVPQDAPSETTPAQVESAQPGRRWQSAFRSYLTQSGYHKAIREPHVLPEAHGVSFLSKQRSQLRFLCSQPVEDVCQGAVHILAGLPAVNTGNQPVIGDIETHIGWACGG